MIAVIRIAALREIDSVDKDVGIRDTGYDADIRSAVGLRACVATDRPALSKCNSDEGKSSEGSRFHCRVKGVSSYGS